MAISKDRKSRLASIIKEVNASVVNKKSTTIGFASDKTEELSLKYIQTPSHLFNAMLGGGLGRGRLVEVFGESGSGKTSLAIQTLAYNQSINPDFVAGWFETEGSIDLETLEMFGVDLDRLVFWDQTEVTAEKGLEILRRFAASGEFDMIVVNSVSGLCPSAEYEEDLEKAHVALLARLMSKLMRVLTSAAYRTQTTVVFINQLRTDVNAGKYQNPNVTSGKKFAF